MFIDAKRLLDVLYQALSQCDLSSPCSIFHSHLFKASQAYSLVRSFKAFLFIGALFLVACLFALCMLVPDD
jgi:hypothetical protein